jgi:Flp pilus assembly CpaF family ATPase
MALSVETRAEAARLLEKSLGGEILACMNDPRVEDLFLNSDGSCFAQYADRTVRLATSLSPEGRYVIIGYAGSLTGTAADGTARYCVDGKLHSGQRFHGVLPPRAVGGPYIVMRNPPRVVYRLQHYVEAGVMTRETADALVQCLVEKKNIIIFGVMGSGKTSLLTCLLNHPAAINDRIGLLEDSEEVNIDAAPNKVVKSTLGGTYRELVYDILRERVMRCIIGEGRDGGVWDWVKALNAVPGGSLITLHADNLNGSMERLEQLAAEVVVDVKTQRPVLIRAAQRLVPVHLLPSGRRCVPGVYEPVGHTGDHYTFKTVCGDPVGTTVRSEQSPVASV